MTQMSYIRILAPGKALLEIIPKSASLNDHVHMSVIGNIGPVKSTTGTFE